MTDITNPIAADAQHIAEGKAAEIAAQEDKKH